MDWDNVKHSFKALSDYGLGQITPRATRLRTRDVPFVTVILIARQ
jgi:hypothetical protein